VKAAIQNPGMHQTSEPRVLVSVMFPITVQYRCWKYSFLAGNRCLCV